MEQSIKQLKSKLCNNLMPSFGLTHFFSQFFLQNSHLPGTCHHFCYISIMLTVAMTSSSLSHAPAKSYSCWVSKIASFFEMCKCSNRATPWQKLQNYIFQAGSLLLVMKKSFALFKFLQETMQYSLQICTADYLCCNFSCVGTGLLQCLCLHCQKT